ncbi:hypothetical protein JCM8547_004629 [Rhodosporidiobolus lusitaniae]
MRLVSTLLVGVLASTAAFAAPTQQPSAALLVRRQSTSTNSTGNSTSILLPPSLDPFYSFPNLSRKTPNGAILRSRTVSTELDDLANGTWQVLYKTTAADGTADATVATLFRPLEPVQPPRVMLYLAPTDTAAPDCVTSFSLSSPSLSSVSSPSALIEISAALEKGWYVSLPDHEGSKAAFISGVTEARAGLDGLRAALRWMDRESEGSYKGYKAVIRGYSGGGHAAAWATQYLETYGRGLNVVGTAAGGVPVDLYPTFDLISGTNNTALAFSAVAGLANVSPSLSTWLSSHLYPNGTAALAYARNNSYCLDATNSTDEYPWAGNDVYSFFEGGERALYEGVPARVLRENTLGVANNRTGSSGVWPSIPIFLFHSKTDETVSYSPVKPYFRSQCSHPSVQVHLSTVSGYTHVETFAAYLADSFEFMDSAFNGTATMKGCESSNGPKYELLGEEYVEIVGTAAVGRILSLAATASNAGGARMRL